MLWKSCSIVQTHNPNPLSNKKQGCALRGEDLGSYVAFWKDYNLALIDDFSQSCMHVLLICGFYVHFSRFLCSDGRYARPLNACKVSSRPLSFGVVSRSAEALSDLPFWKANGDSHHACWQVKAHHGCHRKLLNWVMWQPEWPQEISDLTFKVSSGFEHERSCCRQAMWQWARDFPLETPLFV